MSTTELLERFHTIATNPAAQKDAFLAEGKKIILMGPGYEPEEIVHSMGLVPMGVWGADMELTEAKKYFPAFISSLVQSVVELGIKGTYDGASAFINCDLTDNLKVLGENWKYAVPSIPFIPMSYPQNRKPAFGADYTRAGYKRVIKDLEEITGATYSEEALGKSIEIYNEHNAVMRELSEVLSAHPEVTNRQRCDVFKSAWFMLKEDHTALVKELIEALNAQEPGKKKNRVITSGLLCDAPGLLDILDELDLQIAADDVLAESRQYRTDAVGADTPLECLVRKFCESDNCSLLYDPAKKRIGFIVDQAKAIKADGVILVLTKFCDTDEFDNPLIRKACEAADIPCTVIEVDRQMVNYEQARTALETFRDIM